MSYLNTQTVRAVESRVIRKRNNFCRRCQQYIRPVPVEDKWNCFMLFSNMNGVGHRVMPTG